MQAKFELFKPSQIKVNIDSNQNIIIVCPSNVEIKTKSYAI